MSGLVRNLREEATRLSGLSLDRGVQEAGISANLADRAADVIEEYQAKEVLADRAHKTMTAEIEKFQRNLRHWREECGKLHAKIQSLEPDAKRYRYLKEHCSSHYGMTWEQPAEWSIGWEFQQSTPAEAYGSFDKWIDQDIEAHAKRQAEIDADEALSTLPELDAEMGEGR